VNQDQIPCFAFVVVNYSPIIGGIGMFMNSLSFFLFLSFVDSLLYLCTLNSFMI
jgi:hypothetical protein